MSRFNACRTAHGFTLIEVVLVVIIAGILATVAMRSVATIGDSVRTEETKQELDRLAEAIVGRPDLHSGGVRNDFGYVGDVGALPPNLDALVTNPGLVTWHGPYIANRFEQSAADFKTDAWGATYGYSGVDLTSSGSGQTIVRKLGGSTDELLRNRVAGNVFDADGTPPGEAYRDSLRVLLSVPNGGGMTAKQITPDAGGYFAFDSIPIGNHNLDIVYLPTDDTLHRFVSVIPRSSVYQEYFLAENVWAGSYTGGGSGVEFVTGSDSLFTSHCNELRLWITNPTGSTISVSSLTLSWPSPISYYSEIQWNGTTVYSGPVIGSSATAAFSSTRTLDPGLSAVLVIRDFRGHAGGGGAQVDMTGATFTVGFSDGSSITFSAVGCY